MKIEKILLTQNDQLLNLIIRDLDQFMPQLVRLQDSYEALHVGDFNNQVWQELRDFGPTNRITHYKMMLAGFETSDIDSIRELTQDEEMVIFELNNCLINVKSFRPVASLYRAVLSTDHISFEDGKFVISDLDKEDILEEHCRTYLQPGDESDLYYALLMVLESHKEFIKIAKRLEIMDKDQQTGSTLNQFFISSGEELKINTAALRPAVEYRTLKKMNVGSKV